ncbi:MAG TPA: D-glycerate dehydrogenase [Pseudomonadales bacterium]|nr:D-glycerate dehydrogenase [Pseudomonadales bacterium]
MSAPVIVIARPLPRPFTDALAGLGEVRVHDPAHPEASLDGARVWLGSAMDPVGATLIESFPDGLGLIANLGVGTDNIDLAAAARAGIAVSNTPVVTEDTADLAMALLLATCRRLGECERALRGGDWGAGAGMLGRRVHGASLGIVGFGAIGQAMARRARGFDMNICYHGPRRKPEAEAELGVVWQATLTDLLAQADIVSLHCPLSAQTRHLINADTLAAMRPGAILVNTGRGPLVDEAALVAALQSGHLGGAGLDVFEFEPAVTPALMSLANVVLLPHIGSATGACRADMAQRALANVRAFLEHGQPLDPVRAPAALDEPAAGVTT